MYKIEFTIQDLPKRINQTSGTHWTVRYRESQKWKRLVQYAIRFNYPKAPLKKANLTFIRYSARSPDFDGIVHSFKCCMDALVKLNIIEDDNPKVVNYPTYKWEKAPKGKGYVKIIVEELLESEGNKEPSSGSCNISA